MEMRESGGGGCCIARYGHGPSSHNPKYYQMSQMDRIMLRYRPIAPKPGPTSSPTGSKNDDVKAITGKGKKRNNGNKSGGGGNNSKRRKSRSPDHHQNDNNNKRMIKSDGQEKCHVVTLPLLPETPDLSPRNNQGRRSSSTATWLNFGAPEPEVVMTSSVTVEGVTDTWQEGEGNNFLGRTDEEKKRALDEDTCPGFISDGWNRVWWTNEAYRRMVITGDTWKKEERSSSSPVAVVVKLGMREKVELPEGKLFGAFTCRVRVQYGKEGSHWMSVPCDVWRMDGGGFAWRLDVKAALSLAI